MPNKVNNFDSKAGLKIKPVPKPQSDIGLDTENDFYSDIINSIRNGGLSAFDVSKIDALSQISNNRDSLYQIYDAMAKDPIISAALEIYCEDITTKNIDGDIVYVKGEDGSINAYIMYLLRTLKVNDKIYKWAMELLKYGDCYIRLYRDSDFEDELFKREDEGTKSLNEDVKVKAYKEGDKLAGYVEMYPNPGELFELTKFGKTYAYVKTNTNPLDLDNIDIVTGANTLNPLYRFNKRDNEVYNATSYVHALVDENITRTPERVKLFNNYEDMENDENEIYIYNVRRGKSILFDVYKIWRQLTLLENALLLSRLTRSSIIRVIEVEVADMPKSKVGPHLQRIKSLVEQKASIDAGSSMQEYTNPGSIENNIYVPVHNGVGAIQTQELGGDADVKDIADLDWFRKKLYAALKIPGQYLGDTDDATGFNGGTSLSIISSRYCRSVERYQSFLLDAITNMINIYLIDRGLSNYIGKFELALDKPVSQEDLDERDAMTTRLGIAQDIIGMVDGMISEKAKLEVTAALLGDIVSNTGVMDIINRELDHMPDSGPEDEEGGDGMGGYDDFGGGGGGGDDFDFDLDGGEGGEEFDTDMGEDTSGEDLPTGEDLGVDLTEM